MLGLQHLSLPNLRGGLDRAVACPHTNVPTRTEGRESASDVAGHPLARCLAGDRKYVRASQFRPLTHQSGPQDAAQRP